MATSMAAAIAASLPTVPTPAQQQKQSEKAGQNASVQVPQRMEGLIDPEGLKGVDSVALSSLVSLHALYGFLANNRRGDWRGEGSVQGVSRYAGGMVRQY